MTKNKKRKISSTLKIFFSLLIFCLFFIQWYGWNEESRFALTRAIVDENRFEIDSFYNLTGDRIVLNDHYYSDKNPGSSLLSSFFYLLWEKIYACFPENFKEKYNGTHDYIIEYNGNMPIVTLINPGFFIFTSMILLTFVTSSIPVALTSVIIYKLSRYFTKNEDHRIFLALIYGLATNAFHQALHFMGIALSTFLAFLSFYLIFENKKSYNPKNIFLSGIFAGFSYVVEPIMLFILIPLIIYVFYVSKRWFLMFLVSLLIGLLPIFIYNYLVLGNPIDVASSYLDRSIWKNAYPETQLPFLKNNDTSKIVKASFEQTSLTELFLEHFHLVQPNPWISIRLLFYPYRGLFFYSPILLLSIIGLVYMRKEFKAEADMMILILVLIILLLSSRRNWWGGYGFGNRYMIPVIPFLVIPITYVIKKIGMKPLIPLFILSFFINILGLQQAEEFAYDWNKMEMRSDWMKKQNGFEILSNPLIEHYIPLTLEYGPRSPLFEHIINGYISIDPRIPPLSKGVDFPKSKFHVPFLVFMPLSIIMLLIWFPEITGLIRGARYENK